MAHGRFLAAILLAASVLIAGCAAFGPKIEPPEWRLVGMKMVDARLLEQRRALTFRIMNPNDMDIPVTGMYVEVEIEGEPFASGVSDKAVTLPAYGEAEVTVLASTNLLTSLPRLAGVLNRRPENIHYRVSGHVSVDLKMIKRVPVEAEGVIALPTADMDNTAIDQSPQPTE